MGDRYWIRLKGLEWQEVSVKRFIEAERDIGFRLKADCGSFATGGFSGHGIEGTITRDHMDPSMTTIHTYISSIPNVFKVEIENKQVAKSSYKVKVYIDTASFEDGYKVPIYDMFIYLLKEYQIITDITITNIREFDCPWIPILNHEVCLDSKKPCLQNKGESCPKFETWLGEVKEGILTRSGIYAKYY